MEIRILGPIGISADGRTGSVGGPKPKTLLALLAVHACHGVSFDQIVDAMWGEEPPNQPRAAIHTYVSVLRKAIPSIGESDVLARSGGGYSLIVEPDVVDLHRFDRAVGAAQVAVADERWTEAVTGFAEALALWRGPALSGAHGWWAENERARLADRRIVAIEDWAEASMRTGQGDTVIADLAAAVTEHPFRERLRAQLVLALHQAGRQADALAEYERGCSVLREELGLEPGPVLRATLDQAVRAERKQAPAVLPDGVRLRPRQMPCEVADFTGRAVETEVLAGTLGSEDSPRRVCAVFGKPGAGKSSLAMHVAHRVVADFPDGQLYAQLRGVQPMPADPGEILASFLRALGVEASSIPAEVNERAQLYRSLLADRRVLVVLDDAADEGQVRPLLPGSRACAVVVTSRERLGALDATHLGLGLLDDDEAVVLLERVVGPERVRAEHEQARELARLCGNLPLALRIAAARLAARPHWAIERLAARLRVQHRVLAELCAGDLEVRGSLALSYQGLSDNERVALRRLGLVDLASFDGWLVAPLVGCSAAEAEDLVERLVEAQLLDTVTGHGRHRYQLHDLIRAFARERGDAEETAEETCAAVTRVAECLLVLVEAAAARTAPGVDGYLDPDTVAHLLADADGWFDGEQAGLVRVVERASELGLTGVATRLASVLSASRFSVRNLFSQWWRTHSAALAAARGAADREGEARLLAGLGWLRYEQDRFDEAVAYYDQAITAYSSIDDRLNQSRTRLALSTVLREQGLLTRAREVLDLAAAELTEPRDTARAAHEMARVATELGDFPTALAACERAASTYREIGDSTGEAMVLRSTGMVHRAAGRLQSAAAFSTRAVEMLRETDERLLLAYATQSLAKVRIRQHRGDAVRDDLLTCLRVCNDMQDGFGQALMLRTLGELDLASGRFAEAKRFLDRSLEWWDALSLPVWRARALRDLSRVLAALGDPDASDAAWAEAHALFAEHGTREARESKTVTDVIAVRPVR